MSKRKSLMREFFKYALPSVVAMWVFSFYTMVDGFFVAWGVGPMALASVNIAMPFVNFIFGLSILCSAGASTVISIYLGKGDRTRAGNAFMSNLVTLVGVSLLLTATSLFFVDDLAVLLGATPGLFEDVKSYLSIVTYFVVFFMVAYFFEVTARADGFPKLAAASVLVAAIANIGLDYLFVIVFGWGIAGAAWATGIAQVLAAGVLLLHFLGGRTRLGFHRFQYCLDYVKRSVRLGIGDSVTEFSVGIVIFLFNNRVLHVIGESGVVSYTVIAYVTTLVLMTMSGIAQGMQPLVGYAHGRGDTGACGYLLKLAIGSATAAAAMWVVLAELLAGPFVSIFIKENAEAALFASTVSAFRIYAISYLFVGINVVLATYFSSVERPVYGIVLSVSRGLVVIGATLFIMAGTMGAIGIWLSPTVSEVACLAIAFTAYRMMTRQELAQTGGEIEPGRAF